MSVFFFNDTATTEIYTLSLHDALPICSSPNDMVVHGIPGPCALEEGDILSIDVGVTLGRSEEHTSELQSHHDLVCRLLLEKKKKKGRRDHDNYKNFEHKDIY